MNIGGTFLNFVLNSTGDIKFFNFFAILIENIKHYALYLFRINIRTQHGLICEPKKTMNG